MRDGGAHPTVRAPSVALVYLISLLRATHMSPPASFQHIYPDLWKRLS